MPISTHLNAKTRLTLLCLSGFELYSRWVPLCFALYCAKRVFVHTVDCPDAHILFQSRIKMSPNFQRLAFTFNGTKVQLVDTRTVWVFAMRNNVKTIVPYFRIICNFDTPGDTSRQPIFRDITIYQVIAIFLQFHCLSSYRNVSFPLQLIDQITFLLSRQMCHVN